MNGMTAVVTGGTRGIGRAVATAFAAEGATVVIGARDGDAVEATARELEEFGVETAGVQTDVRDEADVARLAEVGAQTGTDGIDILVPAAGVYAGPPGETPVTEASYAAFDDHLETNARGVYATIQESLPYLTDRARVLVPTGAVARTDVAGYGTYAISKAAAEAVSRGFAADTDYTVGCLDPGIVATDLSGNHGREPDAIAPMFVWAAIDADPETVDGAVVGLAAWKRATR